MVGEQPHGLAVSDDGRLAFVTNTLTTRSEGNRSAPAFPSSISPLRRSCGASPSALQPAPRITYAGGKVYFTAEVAARRLL